MGRPSNALPATRDFFDLEAEVAYWRDYYARSTPSLDFSAYEPAIRLGIQASLHAHGRSFEEIDLELGDCYQLARHGSSLDWAYAKAVAQASWMRVQSSSPPDGGGNQVP
jgi:hypothetical protein